MIKFHRARFEDLEPNWNEMAGGFPWFKIYHSLEWLNFIKETQGLKRILYAITLRDEIVGWKPGFLIQKGPPRIFASPFEGWTTAYMGPLIRKDVSEATVLRALYTCHWTR